jgi:L-alanine-DL-glutamate epimerase-like enolase superfamily enzyme
VAYLIDFLHELKSRSAAAYARIQYIEQPTARDLKAHPENVVHEAAKLVPVVIDESLVSKEAFLLALEMGYSGAALKACKGQTESLLIAALGQKKRVFLCVQDLTCPGASLVHSVTLAAHVPGVKAIEANARQYVPAANAGWEKKFPGIFNVKDGLMRTDGIDGPGLGVIPA